MGRATLARGSNASRTASANRFAANTRVNESKAAANDHRRGRAPFRNLVDHGAKLLLMAGSHPNAVNSFDFHYKIELEKFQHSGDQYQVQAIWAKMAAARLLPGPTKRGRRPPHTSSRNRVSARSRHKPMTRSRQNDAQREYSLQDPPAPNPGSGNGSGAGPRNTGTTTRHAGRDQQNIGRRTAPARSVDVLDHVINPASAAALPGNAQGQGQRRGSRQAGRGQ